MSRFLGEGSNAHVFLATDPDRRSVVVKRIKEEAASSPRFRQFFAAEVKSMRRFKHPYVVRLIDASLDDPLGPCLVLDYILGTTLEGVLEREKTMAPDRVGRFLGPLAHALYAAQLAGIAHRDLKPANLMVTDYRTDRESVRVMDFGFAGFTTKPHIQLSELTGRGQIAACGTPAYVSPEMVRGDSTDARADIYSVGVMLFEMLTGRLPFEQQNLQDLLESHVRTPPPRFHRIGYEHISPAVEGVVQIALSKYPSERHQSMKELCEQFSKAVGWDVWEMTAPAGYSYDATPVEEAIDLVPVGSAEAADPALDPYILSDRFEATLPEKLAAIKLRGFIEDARGEVVESEPGLIRVRVETPTGGADGPRSGSRVIAFLSGVMRTSGVAKGSEPIEIELRMQKLDQNKVAVQVAFRPVRPYLPTDPEHWAGRCEAYYSHLRKFIMPEG
ncbi:MAG: serine/threonine protein kinase [Fimbriiglobus sp.]|nr:serine/threonine protein kinase [Fimbriiglobus sp.]